MRTDYTGVFRNESAVGKYENVVYAPDTYSSAVNARQRVYLRALVRRSFPDRRPIQHDFATGTGRAIRILHGMVRAAHGYDTSPAMLARARESGVHAQLHEIAESGPVPQPASESGPCLVTVFRLLLNVPDEVRDRAITFAALALPHAGSGLLVVENHGNRSSIRHLNHARRAGNPWFNELSHRQVEELLTRYQFRVVARRGFALCPPGAYTRSWLLPLATRVDNIAARIPVLARFATTVLYVARRTVPAAADPAPASRAPDRA